MAKKILSILIGTDCTKVCEVNYKKNYKNKGIRVYRSIIFDTPKGSVEDGFINDIDLFGEELKKQLRAAKIKSDKVIFSINSSRIANREILMPQVNEKQIMNIINMGASEYFPIDVDDYILSYNIIEKNTVRTSNHSNRKSDKKKRKLAKRQEKLTKKAIKKKSKTEIIAENLERMQSENYQKKVSIDNENIPTREDSKESTNQMRLAVYAAPSLLIKNYYYFAKKMNLDIVAIDYYGNSSYQAIKRQSKRGTNVFVQMNEQDTIISILKEDVLILQRTVSYGLNLLLDTVKGQGYNRIISDKDVIDLLREKDMISPNKKNNKTFDEVAATDSIVDVDGSFDKDTYIRELAVKENIRDSLLMLVGNVSRMLDYYKSSNKRIDIDTIYLTGALVNIKGVEEFFSNEIGLPHKVIHKLNTISSRKRATSFRQNPSDFLTLVGAVINPVDFVPYEFTLRRQRRSTVIASIILTLICLAGSASVIYVSYDDYLLASKELDKVRTEYEAMTPLNGLHEAYDHALDEINDLKNFEMLTTSNNDRIKDVIEELEDKLPSSTVIHSMKFTEEGVTMNMTAVAYESDFNKLIAKILMQLKEIDYFKGNVDISGVKVVDNYGVSELEFSIVCTYVD